MATGEKRLLRGMSEIGKKKTTKKNLLDLRDLARDPYPYVSAHPLEPDVYTWHANVWAPTGSPFADAPFHCVLKSDFLVVSCSMLM